MSVAQKRLFEQPRREGWNWESPAPLIQKGGLRNEELYLKSKVAHDLYEASQHLADSHTLIDIDQFSSVRQNGLVIDDSFAQTDHTQKWDRSGQNTAMTDLTVVSYGAVRFWQVSYDRLTKAPQALRETIRGIKSSWIDLRGWEDYYHRIEEWSDRAHRIPWFKSHTHVLVEGLSPKERDYLSFQAHLNDRDLAQEILHRLRATIPDSVREG